MKFKDLKEGQIFHLKRHGTSAYKKIQEVIPLATARTTDSQIWPENTFNAVHVSNCLLVQIKPDAEIEIKDHE